MATSITVINATDLITNSRTDINNNFASLNTNKIETSTLDTDATFAANSDLKIATQKAVKTYVDATANPVGKSWNEYGASSGGTDAYAITIPGVTAYAIGQTFKFKVDVANTGAATLNVNGLGAKTIKRNVSTDLITGDILASQIAICVYDGTNLQLISPRIVDASTQLTGSIPAASRFFAKAGVTTRSGTTASGSQTIAHGLGIAPQRVKFKVFANADNPGLSTTELVISDGVSDGTNHFSVYGGTREGTTVAQNDLVGNSAVACIFLDSPAALGNGQSATAAFDATNITLTWTKSGTGMNSGNMQILWVADA